MRMNRMAALALSAGMITMAACSDSPTAAPSAAALVPNTPSFAAGDPVGTIVPGVPVLTQLIICKTSDSNVGGTFTLTPTAAPSNPEPGKVGGSGNPTIQSPISVAPNQCKIAAIDNGNASQSTGDFFAVAEQAVVGVTQEKVSCQIFGGPVQAPCPVTSFFLNTAHGWVITYRNTEPPPPEVCTYTKGWYQNKNGEPTIIAGIDGRSKADQIEIFNASPGQPGDVEWGVNGATDNKPNNLLNLYQQLLAALNNLDGNATAGPPAVDAAIAAALSITSGSGTTISVTTAGVAQISGLINTLSSFNQGEFAGFPHCGDEVLQ